ncbi:DeoR/GlpR family DNA-binding transcription regulator [Herbiconiux sp. KACC 21604]|uniref:DeoR/GlpR family DNA-binding transcription regulator n=1 Tax=unclassified Herbiconiux TaxID=2618217 RepID=UPI0014910483|nr:DeoR/GlpR family DNA-binding transcription regulator [Herbiconiux sp. SALV-R1]QJU52606.1 DeoR/GlpR transcriptional regulator [Herbiconiux sp. SALV-R1]WPO87496.1 DeoR/GlpR family DNA-binding transcription regulator [Herbiconiux sp. KACC 21604]
MAAVIGAERRELLLGRLEEHGVIRLEEAAAELGVSTMTVRRDLEALEREGVVVRVRGGAVATVKAQSFDERQAVDDLAKSEIARKAADLVPASGAIALDASSTSAHLLAQVRSVTDLVIATNSAHNHARARSVHGARAVLLGGELEPRTDSFVGPVACAAAALFNYDRFFTSASAADLERGTSETIVEEGQVKREMARAARETVLLITSAKLGQHATAAGLPWSSIDIVVTELDPADPLLDPLRPLVELR